MKVRFTIDSPHSNPEYFKCWMEGTESLRATINLIRKRDGSTFDWDFFEVTVDELELVKTECDTIYES